MFNTDTNPAALNHRDLLDEISKASRAAINAFMADDIDESTRIKRYVAKLTTERASRASQ